jgi:hypothetical protein
MKSMMNEWMNVIQPHHETSYPRRYTSFLSLHNKSTGHLHCYIVHCFEFFRSVGVAVQFAETHFDILVQDPP